MEPRLDAYKRVPGALPAMRGLENLVRESGLEAPLLELVRIRASQMNGCAYCLDMHSKDARAAGETEQRLDTLSAWRETAFFTVVNGRRSNGLNRPPTSRTLMFRTLPMSACASFSPNRSC
jgi:AhpD family alkylhydroperoxidase